MVPSQGIVTNYAIQPPQQGFILPPLFTAQCLQYQSLEHPCQSVPFPVVSSLEPPTTNNYPQEHQSEQRNSQSNAVEPFLPSSQPGLVVAAVANQQCSDTTESSHQSTEQLTLKNAIDKGQSTFSELVFTKKVCDSGAVLEVTQQKMHYVPESGYISLARILFVPGDVEPAVFNYTFQVLFSTLQDGNVSCLSQFISVCSLLSKDSQYKFCPGLDEKHTLIPTSALFATTLRVFGFGKNLSLELTPRIVCCGTSYPKIPAKKRKNPLKFCVQVVSDYVLI